MLVRVELDTCAYKSASPPFLSGVCPTGCATPYFFFGANSRSARVPFLCKLDAESWMLRMSGHNFPLTQEEW